MGKKYPPAGDEYKLKCIVHGADATFEYHWKYNDTILENESSEYLSFPVLRLFHAGCYTCLVDFYSPSQATVTSDPFALHIQSEH